MFKVGNYPNDTGLTLVDLFNRSVLEQGTSYASPGRSLTLALNVVSEDLDWSDVGLFQAPPFRDGVSDTQQSQNSNITRFSYLFCL
ncbi:MAG: hypothetical protein C6Y22_06020 [Hapalosiphonaceae cyanobacterium JJU2]|nr:MAG: hypothetical protein C6Y22_06020 [Hapalosiphonaceae cyanobacterium JJU2]